MMTFLILAIIHLTLLKGDVPTMFTYDRFVPLLPSPLAADPAIDPPAETSAKKQTNT